MTPRRKPYGCVFWPKVSPLVDLVADDDREIAVALANAISRATSPWTNALEIAPFVGKNARYVEIIGVNRIFLVLIDPIRYGRTQGLFD